MYKKVKFLKKNDFNFYTKSYEHKMTLKQLIIAEIERRNKVGKKEKTFEKLEDKIKKNAIKERFKSKMDIYMMSR